jgi:hypothetical protein
MRRDLTPEDQLGLLLARGRFSPDVSRQAVDQLEAGPRWDVVLDRSRVHGLIPLLYHRLSALAFRGVPPPVRRELTDTFGVNAIRNLLLAEELTSILTQLGAAGVPVIPLITPSTKWMTLFSWRRIGHGVHESSSAPVWASPE